jgi:hypothetical protein
LLSHNSISIILLFSHCDSIDPLEYIILFYYITILILYYSHYHIIHILLFSLLCYSHVIQLCYYYIMILWYYYITILLYYYIIQLFFCRRLRQGVVTVRPTLVHPPPYCPSPCRLWRRRITATRALLTLPRPTLVQPLPRSPPLHRLWQWQTARQQKASVAITISIAICSSF